ncbi:MAG: hypothetical protein K8L99_28475 [Anaerolineae bacterium]|nr:hypothetical protein [Anaerolineae bacterium]
MAVHEHVTALLQQLEQIYADIESSSKLHPSPHSKSVLQNLYDDLCDALLGAPPDSRADILIAFQFRPTLIEVMGDYFQNIAQQAAKAVHSKRQRSNAINLTQRTIAAFSIVNARLPERDLTQGQQDLFDASTELNLDIDAILQAITVPAKYYVQRAIQYHRGKQPVKALKALYLGLKASPSLEKNDRVIALATTLTGESPMSAMITLSDGYVLEKFIEGITGQASISTLEQPPRPRSTLEIIRSWLS